MSPLHIRPDDTGFLGGALLYKAEYNVRGAGLGGNIPLHLSPGENVERVKDYVRAERGVPVSRQQLEYCGEELYSRRNLEEQSIPRGAALYLRGNSVHQSRPPERDPSKEMKQAILWDDGSQVQTLLDYGYGGLNSGSIDGHGPNGTLYGGC